jgi:hypothetical protein
VVSLNYAHHLAQGIDDREGMQIVLVKYFGEFVLMQIRRAG